MEPNLVFAQEVEMARLHTLRLEAQEEARLYAPCRIRRSSQRRASRRDERATSQNAFWKLIRV